MHRATRRLRKTLLLGLGVLSLCSVLTSKGKTEEAQKKERKEREGKAKEEEEEGEAKKEKTTRRQ